MAGQTNGTNGAAGREQLRQANAAIRDALDFPEEYLAPAYRHGVALYEHHRYAEAGEVFQFLAACDCTNPALWKALGASRKMLGRHEEAVAAFGMAVASGSTDPWVPVHAAECLMHLHRYPEAVAALRHAAGAAKLSPEEAPDLGRRLGALLQGVERSLAA